MKINTVILDWAGTTVDFGCFAPVRAFIEAFQKFEIEPTVEEVRKPMGMLKRDHIKCMMQMPRIHDEWIRVHGKDWTEADVDQVYELSESGIMEILNDYAEVKPFVLETVAYLKKNDYRIGSTTGYTDAMMEIVTKKALENGYAPDCWFSPESVENCGRPYPYMIYRNMQTLGVKSVEQVVKVGDTVADILEGKNAGVLTVGVIEGSSIMALSEDEFAALDNRQRQRKCEDVLCVYEDCGADYVIHNMSELPALLERINNGR